MVVTKGDNVEAVDSPVEPRLVRGRVVFSVPRELWIPLFLAFLWTVFYELVKTPVVGYSYAILFVVGLMALAVVYATTPRPIDLDAVKLPILNLAGVYFDPLTCYIKIRYTGELSITSAVARINSTYAEPILVAERELVLRPSPNMLRLAFEKGRPLAIEVNASLNRVGKLLGVYTLLIGGVNPEISAVDRALLIRNPNCFPIAVNTSMGRLSNGRWIWDNRTYVIEGFSQLVVEPLEDRYTYVYVYWFNQGDRRWIGLPLR